MLIKQICQKSVIFVTIGNLKILILNMSLIFAMDCRDLMQKAMSFNNVVIVYVKGNSYRIHFWYMSKDDAINIKNGSNLVDKRDVL